MLSCSRHLMAAAAAGASVPPPPPQMQFAISPSAEPIPHLKPSSSSRRKPSFYFPRMRDEAYDKSAFRPGTLGSAAPLFAITSTSCDYYALRLPLLKAGFRRVDAPYLNLPSNLLWGRSMLTLDDVEPPFFMQLTNRFQRFNHFPSSHKNLGCKRGMGMNVYAFLSTVAQRDRWGELMPKTWFYPEDRAELERVFAAAPNDSQFIWKPARGSCGRGICITQGGPSHAADWKTVMNEIDEKICSEITGKLFRQYVVQSYLQDPLLLEEHKMDLRLYVLVTSYDPLVVYWFDEGLVRLAAEEYTEHDETTGDAALTHANLNRFRHLTNFSVGRKFHADDDDADANANASDAAADKAPLELDSPTEGTPLKWSLAKLWRHIDTTIAPRDPTQRPASAEIKEQIALLITRTLMAVKPILTGTSHKKEMSQDGSFFEIYGFDVILDKSLHPLLLEVNTMPSLESSSCFDYAVKTSVVADVLNMAMLQPFDRSAAAFHPAGGVVSEDFRGLEPPSAEARHYIHTAAEVQATSSMSMKEHMEELRHRLKDEDLYSRGFKRIFPPLPTSRRDAPLTAASEDIRRDIDMYREMKLLSPRDEAVLADV